MGIFQKFFGYLNPSGFLHRDEASKKNVNLRFMHGINRISIWMMLAALIIMIIRYAFM